MKRPSTLVTIAVGAALGLAAVAPSTAQQPSPSPSPTPAPGEPVLVSPPAPEVDRSRKEVRIRIPAPPSPPASVSGPALRAVSLREGEGRLLVGKSEQTVRPGDRLGKDVVKAVAPGRLVLDRPATAGLPPALVVVDFDEAGRSRTRVYYGPEAAPTPPPDVR
jgi:hypothetical protein